MKEVDRLKKGIRVRKPGSDLGLYMFRSLTPHVKWVGPALLSQFAFFFFFLSAPQFSAEQSVFFHSALGDDSLGLLRFILSRIRAGRLLIILYRLSSFVC